MPYLGDYIGHLLSEMTIARMHADLEAVRVAELYASHPLLRFMPVPHFRLPEMDLDVPVVIKEVEEPRADESPRGGVPITELRKTFDQVLTRQFTKHGLDVSPENKKTLKSALDEKIGRLSQPKETAVDVHRIADELTNAAVSTLTEVQDFRGPIEKKRIETLEAELKDAIKLEFLKLRRPPPRLNVLATTQEIREAGPSEIVTRIKLKLTEQAVEWTSVESEGQKLDRLVPE
jgi:hypothetical protein